MGWSFVDRKRVTWVVEVQRRPPFIRRTMLRTRESQTQKFQDPLDLFVLVDERTRLSSLLDFFKTRRSDYLWRAFGDGSNLVTGGHIGLPSRSPTLP